MNNREIAKEYIRLIMKIKKYIKMHIMEKGESCITEQQFRTLLSLKNMGKSALKELSKNVHVSTSSLCTMLNKLVDKGYVSREIDIKDRRNTYYILTPTGQLFLNNELEKRLDLIESKIDKLDESKKKKFLVCIKELEDILEEIK